MKNRIAILSTIIAASISASLVSGAESRGAVLTTIQGSLPDGWRIAETRESVVPYWSFSDDRCTEITIVGPNRTGYRYLDGSDNIVLEHLSQREAIVVWIASSDFDPQWNIGNRIKNRLNKTPITFPSLLHDKRFRTYGEEGLFADDKTYAKKAPSGTAKAVHLGISRSWMDWRTDISKALEAGNPP